MPNVTVANAFVQVMPSMNGATGMLSAAIAPEATKAGNAAGLSIGSAIGGKLKTAGKVIGAGLVAGFGVATAAAIGFAKSSVDVGREFDASMSQVAATMGKTTDEISDLRDYAKEMGAQTAFSATQAADALNYMALAGYDSQTSMSMLPNVLNLAAAGGIELATASDMVTDAQSALGLSLDETTELVDKMAMASSKSNTSVGQLGDAILTVGGTAKNLAGGTTELATSLGILADNGIKGAEGGTALRNIILSLSAPTDVAAKALKDLGIDVFDAEGNMRSLNDIFTDFNGSLSQMTQGEQTQVLSTIFNKVDLKSVNALLANTGDRFNELSGYIDQAQGSAQKMADTQLDNLEGDMTLFQSALEGVQISLSEALTPALREFVQWGTGKLGEVTAWVGENQEMFDGLAQTLAGGLSEGFSVVSGFIEFAVGNLGTVAAFVSDNKDQFAELGETLSEGFSTGVDMAVSFGQFIMDNFPTVATATGAVVGGFVAFRTAMMISETIAAFSAAVGLATGAEDAMAVSQGVLNAVMGANPIVKIVTLLGSLVGALVVAYNTNEDFRNTVNEAWESVWGTIEPIVTFIGDGLSSLGEWFGGLGESIGQWAEDTGNWWSDVGESASEFGQNVQEAIGGAWDTVTTKTGEAWETASGFLSEKWEGLKGTAADAWSYISGQVTENLNTAKEVGSESGAALTSLLSGDWESAKEHAANAYESIKNNITGKLDSAKGTAVSIADQIGDKLGFPGLGDTVGGVFDAVKSAIEDPIGTAKNYLHDAIEKIKGFFNFKISWPHIPMPHFNVSPAGWQIGDLLKGSIPSLSVEFYAQGGIIDKPTLGVIGEAGTEAVVPLTQPALKPFAQAVASQLQGGRGGDTTVHQTFNVYANDPAKVAAVVAADQRRSLCV